MKRYIESAIGGFFGTFAHTFAMMALYRLLHADRLEEEDSVPPPLPPRRIILRGLRKVLGLNTEKMTESQKATSMALVHFAYGTTTGALYPVLEKHLPGSVLKKGAVFGIAVWAGSYLGWLPPSRLYNVMYEESRRNVVVMVSATALWGVVTALVAEKLRSLEPGAKPFHIGFHSLTEASRSPV